MTARVIQLAERRERHYRLILDSLAGERVSLVLRPWAGAAFEVTGCCLGDRLVTDDGRELLLAEHIIESFV
jgi:hypothetical protein